MNDELKFKNGKFKIMQIADTQEKFPLNPDTLKLIKLAVEKEMPDLVVFSGDQISGYSPCFKDNTLEKVKNVISDLTAVMRAYSIPYTATFGNHDRDCGISNSEQMEKIYKKLPYFIYSESRSSADTATFCLTVKSSDGKKDALALYIIDSNAKEPDGVYSPVYKEQIKWYKEKRDELKKVNGNYIPAIVFQHIPLPEFYKALKRCSPFKKGRVEAFFSHKNEFYVLDDETISKGGFMKESPAAPDINNGEFEAFKEKGDILGVFVGHDHINSFVKKVEGIDLGYTQCCGFNTYGPGSKRGVRIFEIDENNPENYKNYTVTMEQLCDYKPSKPTLEFILSHAPSSVKQVEKYVKIFLCAAAAAATTYFLTRKTK